MSSTSKLPRLRFSLRTAFLVVTILSIAAAIPLAHHRRTAVIESWDRALRNAICENIARLPAGGKFADPPEVLAADVSSSPTDINQSPRLTYDDLAPLTYWSPAVTLDPNLAAWSPSKSASTNQPKLRRSKSATSPAQISACGNAADLRPRDARRAPDDRTVTGTRRDTS